MPPRSTGCRTCVRRRVKCDETRPTCLKCIRANLNCSGFPPKFQFIQQEITRIQPNRYEVYNCFLLREFVATGINKDWTTTTLWISPCLADENSYPTSSLAIRALSSGFFGGKNGEHDITQDASKLYGKALLALRDNLQDPQKVWSYDTLAATMALSLCEYIFFTSTRGWISHAHGVAKLIQMRGPKSFNRYPDRAILEMNRSILIMEALAARKRTFLEEERWQLIEPIFTPRPIILRLLDIFSQIPGLAEDLLSETSFKIQEKASSIVNKLRDLEMEVETPMEKLVTNTIPTPPFEAVFEYDSLEACIIMTTFDAVMICALEWRYRAFHPDWQRGRNHEAMIEIPETLLYAQSICRSLHYLIAPQNFVPGSFYMLFPTRIAYQSLPRQSYEAMWLEKVSNFVADRSGFEMARNILHNIPLKKMRLDEPEKRTKNGDRDGNEIYEYHSVID